MAPTEPEIELRSRHQDEINPEPTPSTEAPTTIPIPPVPILQLLSCGFSFFVAGTNDGSLGALIPYIISTYQTSTSLIALLYLTTFLGWALAALTNTSLSSIFPLGTLLVLGSVLQIIPHALRVWEPPFPLFCITFFLSGLGQAYQDSHANTFVSTVKGAHRWLGFIHAMYGLGLLVSPFVATGVASATRGRAPGWTLFYLFPGALSVGNFVLVILAFKESIELLPRRDHDETGVGTESREVGGERSERGGMSEVQQMLKLKNLWIFSLFFFFYLGVCFTSAG
jgi:fucose permease